MVSLVSVGDMSRDAFAKFEAMMAARKRAKDADDLLDDLDSSEEDDDLDVDVFDWIPSEPPNYQPLHYRSAGLLGVRPHFRFWLCRM